MADSAPIANSLLTEHFRWTPLSLIDDIINSVNELLYRAVSAIETGLLSASPTALGFVVRPASPTSSSTTITTTTAQADAKREIENGVHQLETLLEATVDKNFDKLEIYLLRSVLAIPEEVAPWIRLGHYENLHFGSTADAPDQAAIDLQRRKLRETEKLNTVLQGHVEANERLIHQLHSLLSPRDQATASSTSTTKTTTTPASPLSFLTAHPSARALSVGSTAQPLATTSAFSTSQIPAIRALLSTLTPQLPRLLSAPSESTPDERVQYVEGEVKRHLQQTRGLELDEQGAVREGEWQSEGRSVPPGELRDLERVVARLKRDASAS
ncbi:MAG: hypothetical protein M1838_005092 [Thelocarpon superellum]|nr:MAG: hypothetical protein M1838_005092 [Thelocarpon superellum]